MNNIFFLLARHKVDFIAPCGTNKSTFWPYSRKKIVCNTGKTFILLVWLLPSLCSGIILHTRKIIFFSLIAQCTISNTSSENSTFIVCFEMGKWLISKILLFSRPRTDSENTILQSGCEFYTHWQLLVFNTSKTNNFFTTLAWKIRYSTSVEHSEFGQFDVVFFLHSVEKRGFSFTLSSDEVKKSIFFTIL